MSDEIDKRSSDLQERDLRVSSLSGMSAETTLLLDCTI